MTENLAMNELQVMPLQAHQVPSKPSLPLVEARNLCRSYRQGEHEVVAVANASCIIQAGARIAITGRSGSGKSTLLHLLGGLDTPTSGTITWPALGPPQLLRPAKIAMVFQTQSLLPPLTVLENVELPLLLNGRDKSEAQSKAWMALSAMQLHDLADKLPEELSGGQAQQVALARALACRPSLILADEPSGQLDHATAQRLFDVLLDAMEESDSALVVATHDNSVAERLHIRWHMEHGVLERETT